MRFVCTLSNLRTGGLYIYTKQQMCTISSMVPATKPLTLASVLSFSYLELTLVINSDTSGFDVVCRTPCALLITESTILWWDTMSCSKL